jgi:hypothetical protein
MIEILKPGEMLKLRLSQPPSSNEEALKQTRDSLANNAVQMLKRGSSPLYAKRRVPSP